MRNSKRFLTLVLAVLTIMSTLVFSTSAAFTDVQISNKALYQATGLLSYLGVTKGTTETTFDPDKLVTREQMAAFVYRLMKAGKSLEGGNNTSTFTDLTDPTFYGMVSWANVQGVIKGRSETTFDPKGNITLQDAYAMVVRALGYEKDEKLPYPYGYIDQAETIKLDKNLPSTLNYTDPLTRGNIAIILYNAFFADMAEGETSYKSEIVDKISVAVPVTTYKTVAEKIFNVTKDTQQVVATPHYYLDNNTIDNNFDSDTVLFDGTASYRTFAELGLTGKADDYFLADFNLYLKDEEQEDGTTQTKVLYAEPLLTKKTSNKVTVGKVNPTIASDYYAPDTKSYTKASGLLTIDGAKAYLFNAPYSYAKPEITSAIAASKGDYYKALNEKDAQFIGLAAQTDDGVYHYVTSKYNTATTGDKNEDIFGLPATTSLKDTNGVAILDSENDPITTYDANIFAGDLNQMYSDGYYEVDTYDSNSDGLIDYIWYKPYTFGQIINKDGWETEQYHNTTNDTAYKPVMVGKVPTIYADGAVVEGAQFKNEDYALAYVNGPANYIKIASIVSPTQGTISSYNSANYILSMKDGTSVNTYGTSTKVYGFTGSTDIEGPVTTTVVTDPATGATKETTDYSAAFAAIGAFSYLYKADYLGEQEKFYVYNGNLLYTDAVSVAGIGKDTAIIIPQEAKTEWGSAMENGFLVKRPALTAYVGGTTSTSSSGAIIPVVVDNNTPTTKFVKASQPGEDDYYDFSAYADQICTFTTDSEGIYKLSVAMTDINDDSVLEDDDEKAEFGFTKDSAYLTQVTGTTYSLTSDGAAATTSNSSLPSPALYVSITTNSKIIIKSKSETNSEWIFSEYSANKLPNIANQLQNVQVILLNNPTSTRTEYLAVLYATVDGVINTSSSNNGESSNVRLVKTNQTVKQDSDNIYHYYYDVYNPFTGTVESNIPGLRGYANASTLTSSAAADVGSFYEVSNGVLQDKDDPWFYTGSSPKAPIYAFTTGGARIAPNANGLGGKDAGIVNIANYSGNELEIDGDNNIYKTDADTKVIMLDAGGAGYNDFKWASASVKTVDDLGSNSNVLKNYAQKTNDVTHKLTTAYAKNIEAYVAIDSSKASNDNYKVIDFIIILRSKVGETDPCLATVNQ